MPTVSMKTTSCSVASQGVGVFHGAAAELDDRQPIAERADVAEGLDQDLGLADGVVHLRSTPGGKDYSKSPPVHVNVLTRNRTPVEIHFIPIIHSLSSCTASSLTIEVARGGIWPGPRVARRCRRMERAGAAGAMSLALAMP